MKARIIVSSFKKNPNYGGKERIVGAKDMSFTCEKLPPILVDGDDRWDWSEMRHGAVTAGYIHDPELFDCLMEFMVKNPQFGIKVKSSVHWTFAERNTEPEYLYRHQDLTLECTRCGHKEKSSAIPTVWDDEIEFTSCPVCFQLDTYPDVEYETVEEFLKRTKKI